MTLPDFIAARRSIRAFTAAPVPLDLVDRWIIAACAAPAPHHSRPWRFVVVDDPSARAALATHMGSAWREDLESDGIAPERISASLAGSRHKIESAPCLVLGCLTRDGLDDYPDEARQHSEHGMALLSLGAAVENLMLACAHDGYASCWVAAPIFCPPVARDSLGLPDAWLPHAMILIGRPDPDYSARARPPIPLDDYRKIV